MSRSKPGIWWEGKSSGRPGFDGSSPNTSGVSSGHVVCTFLTIVSYMNSPPVALGWMGGLAAVYWFSSRLGTTAFLALCWVCAFTLPVGYSKKQAEVDGLVATAKSKASEVWATAKSKIPTKGEKAPEEKKAD